MPFTCPSCKRSFDKPIRDELGVACPHCGAQIDEPGGTAPDPGSAQETVLEREDVMRPQISGRKQVKPQSEAVPGSGARKKSSSGGMFESGSSNISSSEYSTYSTSSYHFDKSKYVQISPGDVLSGFRIDEILGAGAMAVVYKSTQVSLNRACALKILPERFARNPSFVERFDKESGALASLNHPNIVTIYDRGHEGSTYFFVMELIEGTSLRHLMQSGDIATETFVRIVEQICDALSYAHKKEVIHRDIKPSNIMLDAQGNVKLADFGLAGIIAAEASSTSDGRPRKRIVMGTKGYMSPEQEENALSCDGRSDIFALGVVMYEMLTGDLPESFNDAPPSQVNPKADPRLDGIVMKAMAKRPPERYQDARELADAVRAFYREVTATGELCPNCKSENPVREKRCVKCGADLSELFDVCPQCSAENRRDVKLCFNCGANLNELREKVSYRISRIQDEAEFLAKSNRFDDAIAKYQEILGFQGKMFGYAKAKAKENIGRVQRTKAEAIEKLRRGGHHHIKRGRLDEALKCFNKLKEMGVDPADDIVVLRTKRDKCREHIEQAKSALQRFDIPSATHEIAQAASIWVNSPEVAQAETLVKKAAEQEDVIDFQVKTAGEALARNDFAGAREALEFISMSYPNHPRLAGKMNEIVAKETEFKFTGPYQEGVSLFQANRFAEAAAKWQTALNALPEGDQRRAKLQSLLEEARVRSAGPDAVAPETAVAGIESAVAEAKKKPPLLERIGKRNAIIVSFVVGVAVVVVLVMIAAGGGPGFTPGWPEEALPNRPAGKLADMARGREGDWEFLGGAWRFNKVGDSLKQGADSDEAFALMKKFQAGSLGLEAMLRPPARKKKEEMPRFHWGLVAGYASEKDYFLFEVICPGSTTVQPAVKLVKDGSPTTITEGIQKTDYNGGVLLIRLQIEGRRLTAFVNGHTVAKGLDLGEELAQDGRAGLYTRACPVECRYVVYRKITPTTVAQKPPEQKPSEQKPSEQKPPEQKPPEQKPPEQKPPEQKPQEPKPVAPKETPPEEGERYDVVYYYVEGMNLRDLAGWHLGKKHLWSNIINDSGLQKEWYKIKPGTPILVLNTAKKERAPKVKGNVKMEVHPAGTIKPRPEGAASTEKKPEEKKAAEKKPKETKPEEKVVAQPVVPIAGSVEYKIDSSPVQPPPSPVRVHRTPGFRIQQPVQWRQSGGCEVSGDGFTCTFKGGETGALILSGADGKAHGAIDRMTLPSPASVAQGKSSGLLLNYKDDKNHLCFGLERVREGLVARAWQVRDGKRRDGALKVGHVPVGDTPMASELSAYIAGGTLYGFLNGKLAAVLPDVGGPQGQAGVFGAGAHAVHEAPAIGLGTMEDCFGIPLRAKATKRLEQGEIITDEMSLAPVTICGIEAFKDGSVGVTLRPEEVSGQLAQIALMVRCDDKGKSGVWLVIKSLGKPMANYILISKKPTGEEEKATEIGKPVEEGKDYHIRLYVRGNKAVAYVNGVKICSLEGDIVEESGLIGFRGYNCRVLWKEFELPYASGQ